MTTTCAECLRPCPEHGHTFCATCHTHDGDCSYGGCEQLPVTVVKSIRENGTISEVRAACAGHVLRIYEANARVGEASRIGVLS